MDSARRRRYAGLDEEGGSETDFVEIEDALPWYKRRFIQAVMIVAAIALVVGIILAIAIPVALNKESDSNENKRVFAFDDIFNTTTEGLSLQWWCPTTPAAAASFVYQDKSGNVIRQIVTNATRSFPDAANQEVLFNQTAFVAAAPDNAWASSIGSYYISPAGGDIIFAVNQTYRWRHSYFANFYVYSISAKTATLLDDQNRRLMNPVWAASGNIAFVRDNNVYIKDTGANTIRQVTTDGTPGRQSDGVSIVNGVQSWVYEEEVFSDMTAMWWSTDGAHLAYLKFNETLVPEFLMPVYDGDAYPEIDNLAYPKPGFANPEVTVGVYNVANESTAVLDWSDSGKYEYVTGIWWVDASTVAVRRLNRLQNEEQTVLFNVIDGSSRVLFTKTSKAWIETQFELTFLRETDGSILYFVDLLANAKSYPQVALYNYSTGAFVRFLSDPTNSATWEVTRINQWLPATRTLVYTSTEVSVNERHVYAQSIEGTGSSKVSPSAGWWSASYSSCSNLFTLNFGGNGDLLNVPTVHLHDSQNPRMSVSLVANAQLKEKMSSLRLPRKEFLSIPNAAGEMMSASLLYPPNFNRAKKYPVLMRVYGGPNSQEVTRAYPFGGQKSFDLYMASKGFIVGQADGRGTAAKGEDWRHTVYLNLGTYETQDQLAAAQHFGKLGFVDSSRIGLWGWSYGGYMGGFVGSAPEAEGKLKLTMSVAPVTDSTSWHTAQPMTMCTCKTPRS